MGRKIRLLVIFLFQFIFSLAWAVKTTGRITMGVASSTERFSSTDFGSDKNDTLFSSQRFFYKASEIGENKWEVTSDFRNKYDAFDKLNQQLYQLDSKDEFQIRQLSLRMVNPEGKWSPTFGRSQIPEAGAVFVDGLNLQHRHRADLYSGFFVGLNPKQIDKSYLISDSHASHEGLYLTYQKKSEGWDTNLFLTHGVVQQQYYGQIERRFLFHNAVYQWAEDSRLISMAFLDVVPKTYVQVMNVIYQQSLSRYFSSELGILGIDVIEYQRRQSTLEKLDPSPYKEVHLGFDYKENSSSTWSLLASSGERSSDQLKRVETSLGYRLQGFITKNWDTRFKLVSRKNYTSQDSLFAWGLGYYSKKYETVLDMDYGTQKNDDGTTTHPINTELSLTGFFSKTLYATISLQRSADETVTILGSFLKVGYRFGNQELPPIRDGAAPRGSL